METSNRIPFSLLCLVGNYGPRNFPKSCQKEWPCLPPGWEGPLWPGCLHSLPWQEGLWTGGGAVLGGLCYHGNLPLCFPNPELLPPLATGIQVRQLQEENEGAGNKAACSDAGAPTPAPRRPALSGQVSRPLATFSLSPSAPPDCNCG